MDADAETPEWLASSTLTLLRQKCFRFRWRLQLGLGRLRVGGAEWCGGGGHFVDELIKAEAVLTCDNVYIYHLSFCLHD